MSFMQDSNYFTLNGSNIKKIENFIINTESSDSSEAISDPDVLIVNAENDIDINETNSFDEFDFSKTTEKKLEEKLKETQQEDNDGTLNLSIKRKWCEAENDWDLCSEEEKIEKINILSNRIKVISTNNKLQINFYCEKFPFGYLNDGIFYNLDRILEKRSWFDPAIYTIIPINNSETITRNLMWIDVPYFYSNNEFNNETFKILQLNCTKWIYRDLTLLIAEDNDFIQDTIAYKYCKEGLTEDDIIERLKRYVDSLEFTKITNWLKEINVLFDVKSTLYEIFSVSNFYVLDNSYTCIKTEKNKNGEDIKVRGITGLVLLYCSHTKEGFIKIEDFANMKLATVTSNCAYGFFIKLLYKDLKAPIFIYNTYSNERAYLNFQQPWSNILLERSDNIINLTGLFTFKTGRVDKYSNYCIDKKIHDSFNCSICNGLNFLFHLGCSEHKNLNFKGKKDININFKCDYNNYFHSTYKELSLGKTFLRECKIITYIEYYDDEFINNQRKKNDGIIYILCDCNLKVV
nr:uncharacterized protein LOC128705218 [Cherax quadricarinatus]